MVTFDTQMDGQMDTIIIDIILKLKRLVLFIARKTKTPITFSNTRWYKDIMLSILPHIAVHYLNLQQAGLL